MKNKIQKFHILGTAAVIAILFCIYPAASVRAADPAPSPCTHKWCNRMVEMHEDFLKMLQNQDSELATQVNKIKAANETEKQNLIEATLILIIQQQSAQHAEMDKMITEFKKNATHGECPMMEKM